MGLSGYFVEKMTVTDVKNRYFRTFLNRKSSRLYIAWAGGTIARISALELHAPSANTEDKLTSRLVKTVI